MSLSFIFYAFIGNVYIADQSNQRICKVTVSTGILSTIAGTGTGGSTGDGGAATSALLNFPYGVAVDSSGRAQPFILQQFFHLLIILL